ncbi:MAG: O-antigen ligase family protein [Patescibacteria group bacterium]|nr:O-antigen ligase family protein [Patescibacteria group bacterium]
MNKINWNSIFSLIQKLAFWSSLLIIPLSMSFFFPIFSPFTLIKFFWLQFLAAIILLSSLAIYGKKNINFLDYRRFILSILPVLVFLLAWSLLSFFSVNSLQTWLGSYDRKMGLVFYYFLTIYFSYIVYSFSGFDFKEKIKKTINWQEAVKALAQLITLAGSLVAIYAVLQFFGFDFAVWQEQQLLGRTISTLGQPNFLASFLLFTLPLTIFLLSIQSKFKFKILISLALILQLAALLTTGSRAAWLALIIAVSLTAIIYSWRRRSYRSLLFLPVFVLFLVGAIYLLTPTRLQTLVNFNEGSIALRRSFYASALEIIPMHPWVGVGLENGGEIIVSQYQPEWGIFMKIDGYTDKVHNSVLDVIIQTGFIGLIFWLALYIFWAWQCWRLWLKPEGQVFALAAGTAMFAYSFSLLFGLSDITGVFYFWILAAFVTAGNLSLGENDRKYLLFWQRINFAQIISVKMGAHTKTLVARVSAVSLIFLALTQVYISIGSLQADYYFLQINRLLAAQKYFNINELTSYIQGSKSNRVDLHYYENSIASFALVDFKDLPDLSSKQMVQILINSIDRDLPANSYENKITKARLSCFLRGVESARADFDEIILMSPKRPAPYRYLADCLQASSLSEQALVAYNDSFSLLPDINDSRLNFEHRDYLAFYMSQLKYKQGEVYQDIQAYDQAAIAYQDAFRYFPQDLSLLKKSADMYYVDQNLEASAKALQQILQSYPSNIQILLNLAKVYSQLNQADRAQDYLQQVLNIIPDQALPKASELIYN